MVEPKGCKNRLLKRLMSQKSRVGVLIVLLGFDMKELLFEVLENEFSSFVSCILKKPRIVLVTKITHKVCI